MEIEQNKTKFKPTLKQLRFALCLVKSRGNVNKAFEMTGKDGRSGYYTRWLKQEGFPEWLNDFCYKAVMQRSGQWYLWLEKHAESGSLGHIDRLLQIAERFTPTQKLIIEGELDVNLNGNFTKHVDEITRRFGCSLS